MRAIESWPPCARCGRPDGLIRQGYKSPQRTDGRPYGFDGMLCASCYRTMRRNPDAKLSPTKMVRKGTGLTLFRMADTVLAFKRAMDSNADSLTISRKFLELVDMAERASRRYWEGDENGL